MSLSSYQPMFVVVAVPLSSSLQWLYVDVAVHLSSSLQWLYIQVDVAVSLCSYQPIVVAVP